MSTAAAPSSSSTHSRAFQPFRALGLVTNHVPFSLQTLGGRDQFVTTCIGRSFHVYNCDKLRLVMASDQLAPPDEIRMHRHGHRDDSAKQVKEGFDGQESGSEEEEGDSMMITTRNTMDHVDSSSSSSSTAKSNDDRFLKDVRQRLATLPIRCMASHRSTTITTAGSEVIIWQRGKVARRYAPGSIHPLLVSSSSSALNEIHSLMLLGDIAISLCEANGLRAWSVTDGELYAEIDLPLKSFKASSILHPSTYLNKVLLGSRQGALQLWNIKTQSLIYEFKGWNSPVTALAQSPAVDVVAVGLENGAVYLLNLKQDALVMKFSQENPVTAITFRTDNNPVMATCGTDGNIALWDLEHRRLAGMVKEAHSAGISSIEFLPSQPILLSASADNSIKMWIFDQTDGSARLLRSREGHIAPPTRIRFYGSQGSASGGHDILSAGQDKTFRLFSTIADSQSTELSQGHLKKRSTKLNLSVDQLRLAPIIDFAAEDIRERDWDNIATCHLDDGCIRTWRFQAKAIGKHEIKVSAPGAKATSVTLTACGNFILTGLSSGIIDVHNIQSGLYRGSFGLRGVGHDGAVTGVVVDSVNEMVASCGLDGLVKFWGFRAKNLIAEHDVGFPMTQLIMHRESEMVAAACDDFAVRVFDIDTKRLVRLFAGHGSRITDMTFSPDGRWLVSSSMDTAVRVWDLPSACLVDVFQCESAATSLAFSPNGEYLASSHVDSVGIFLWANRTLFSTVSLKSIPVDSQPVNVRLPSTGDDVDTQNSEDAQMYLSASDKDFVTQEQLSSELITLSTLPKSRWLNLTNLDVIRQRNKPKEAPKTNVAAPFFLPTVAGGQVQFSLASSGADGADENGKSLQSRIVNLGSLESLSPFVRFLLSCRESGDYAPAFHLLKELPPAAIDVEIRSLYSGKEGVIQGLSNQAGDTTLLVLFLEMILQTCATRRDFEVVQSYLNVFVKLHGDALASSPEVQPVLLRVKAAVNTTWTALQDGFQHSFCLIQFMKNSAV